MPSGFDLAGLKANQEHEKAQAYFREELKVAGLESPEAIRALRVVVPLLRILSASLWDGVQGLGFERVAQGQIDSTAIADLGLAMDEYCSRFPR